VVDAAAPASVPQQAKADRSSQWTLARVLPSSRRSLEGVHSNRHRNGTPTRVCSHARHLRAHSAPFSAPHRRWCVLPMLITSPRGNLPGLPGNRDASPGIPVKTCDKKKERNKNKCTSDAADELHQQHGPKDHAGHDGAERNGSSCCCKQCHAIRGKLMPYLDNWPTLLEFVGELNLRPSYNNKCCNVQHKFDKPVMG
jgi:hypothetical protein